MAVAVTTLAGTSAFADSRPQRGTRSSGGAIGRDGGASRGDARRGNDSASRGDSRRGNDSVGRGDTRRGNDSVGRGDTRRGNDSVGRGDTRRGNDSVGRGDTRRGNDSVGRGDTRRGDDSRRGSGRTYENDRNRYRNRYDNDSRYRNTQPYHTRGRISRMHRYGGGYRVWVIGAPFPFFIPDRYYRSDRFRIGLSIELGGYYNPLGYYDYYDGYGYDGYGYDRRSYTRGELRGVVESVDSRRTSFVLRNEDTGSFVTVLPRGRRVYVNPGDYVEVDGTWTRAGYFTAYDIDWPEGNRYDDQYDERYER